MSATPDEVQRQLERLLASDTFASSPRLSGFLRYVALAAAALASGLIAWSQGVFEQSRDPGRPPVIAVLPFAHHSSWAGDALLAARLTDGVTSELARNGALGAVSHTSALQFAGARRPLKDIAQALDADVVLEGTLIVEGDRARISARLVDGRRDRKLWVEEFAGTASDASELQRRIAASVVAAVRRSWPPSR